MRLTPLLCVLLLTGPVLADDLPGAAQAMPRTTLEQIYKHELSDFYRPELSDKFYQTHQLIEQYFTAKTHDRPAIAKQIEAIGLDANVVGRIARIRMYWQELKGGVYYINERVGPHQVIYFLGVPKGYDRTRAWPLVLKLPSAHAFVTDPPPTPEQVQHIYTVWIEDELKSHPDALCIMPMLNLKELWGPSYKGMNFAIQPIFHAYSRVNIDPKRVYMLGNGMSGHAVWNLAVHYPTYFAAINPMSGGMAADFQKIRLPNLRNIYSVVWHDSENPIIDVKYSREIVKILRNFKYDVDYTETKGVGHAPSQEMADQFYDKMRKRVRDLNPREVVLASNRPDTEFNRSDWVQVYQMLNSGAEQKAYLQHGTGFLTLEQGSYRITATIGENNRIDVKSDNVESMRLFVNDQLVDMSKPVSVYVNRVKRFEGIVKPNIDDMLKDMVFLNRGWRFYPGYIDIDFGALPTLPSKPHPKGTIEYTPPEP